MPGLDLAQVSLGKYDVKKDLLANKLSRKYIRHHIDPDWVPPGPNLPRKTAQNRKLFMQGL